jgi:hypothetical protein
MGLSLENKLAALPVPVPVRLEREPGRGTGPWRRLGGGWWGRCWIRGWGVQPEQGLAMQIRSSAGQSRTMLQWAQPLQCSELQRMVGELRARPGAPCTVTSPFVNNTVIASEQARLRLYDSL